MWGNLDETLNRPPRREATLGDRRTALIVTANQGRGPESLIGCFYCYQQ